MKYIAQYIDYAGNSFSCPVTKSASGWVLATANGPREISFYIYGDDVAGWVRTFLHFRAGALSGELQGCVCFQLRDTAYDTVTSVQRTARRIHPCLFVALS